MAYTFGKVKGTICQHVAKLAKAGKVTKFWITTGSAVAVFLVGSGVVVADPFCRSQIEKFQTLLAGILAIFAACIAFWAAVRAANIQAMAGHAQANATFSAMSRQLEHQYNRELQTRQHAETDFTIVTLLCCDYFRKDVIVKKGIMREILKIEGKLSTNDMNALHVQLHPILHSGWRELSLLNPRTMEQIIRLQSVATEINTVVDRLISDTVHAGVISSDILDDLEEHYDMAIKYISEFVPEHVTPIRPEVTERSDFRHKRT